MGVRPNKHINLMRPPVSVVSSDRGPRRSCVVRWADALGALTWSAWRCPTKTTCGESRAC